MNKDKMLKGVRIGPLKLNQGTSAGFKIKNIYPFQNQDKNANPLF
jgi:hypothetical protein